MDLDTTWLTGMYVLGLVTGVTVTLFFVIVALVMGRRPRGLDQVELEAEQEEERQAERVPALAFALREAEQVAAWRWLVTDDGEDEASV